MRVHQTQTDYLLGHNLSIITHSVLCLAMIRNIQEAVGSKDANNLIDLLEQRRKSHHALS